MWSPGCDPQSYHNTHTICSKFVEGRVTLSPMSQVMPSLRNVLIFWQITEGLSALIRSTMYNMLLCYTTEFKGHLNTGNKLRKIKSPIHASTRIFIVFNTQIMCTWPTWEWGHTSLWYNYASTGILLLLPRNTFHRINKSYNTIFKYGHFTSLQ